MSERLTAWFPLLLLAALAGLTFWLDRFVQPPGNGQGTAMRHDPDYIVEGLSAVRMATDGGVKHALLADRMVHYPDDDSTHLSAPRFVSYATAQAPVTITAREALVSSDGENIYFHDNVVITRASYSNRSELNMRTSYLHVIPDDNIARTDRPVTITDANTTVEAVGLELNSETQVLRLLSRVKGTYHDREKSPPRPTG
jgi:lipopolysaccharide export system protein LptC